MTKTCWASTYADDLHTMKTKQVRKVDSNKLKVNQTLKGVYLSRQHLHNENQTEVRTVDSNKLKVNQTLQGFYSSRQHPHNENQTEVRTIDSKKLKISQSRLLKNNEISTYSLNANTVLSQRCWMCQGQMASFSILQHVLGLRGTNEGNYRSHSVCIEQLTDKEMNENKVVEPTHRSISVRVLLALHRRI